MFQRGLIKHGPHRVPIDFILATLERILVDVLPPQSGGDGSDSRGDFILANGELANERFHALLIHAEHLQGGPAYGLRLAEDLHAGLLFRMAHVLMSADNLLAALQLIAQHSDSLDLLLRINVKEEPEHVRLIADHDIRLSGRPRLMSELILGMLWLMIYRHSPPLQDKIQIRISHANDGELQPYRDFFGPGCEVIFGENEDSIRFSRRDALRVNPTRDPALFATLNNLVHHTIALLLDELDTRQNQDWYGKVREAISAQMDHKNGCSIESVAERMHITPRTLQRKLQPYRLTYSQMLEQCRKEQVLLYLYGKPQPLKVIAARLGYTSTSSLQRAFQRWYGTSLTEYLSTSPKVEPGEVNKSD